MLRLIPLGGLGEVGANCLLLEQGDESVAIDVGATFPVDDYGVDYLHPRFDHLLDRLDRFRGVVLTHGHEDHIGALGALARSVLAAGMERLDVWGPEHALRLVATRLTEEEVPFVRHGEEAPPAAHLCLRVVEPGAPFQVGPFTFEAITVTHSIPCATALAIDTAAGRVLHTGDFKLDPEPVDGQPTDEPRLAALGDAGLELLLSDSTNVLREGFAGSERTAAAALDRVMAEAPERLVVGLFASNLHRVRSVGEACARHGRKLVLLGRSVRRHVEVGRAMGLLDWPSDRVVSPEAALDLPRREVAVLASGTQGEARGALRRLASASHPALRLEPGDCVALSSRVIPGCERAVYRMVDDLLRLGVEVRHAGTDPDIHVSGHAQRGDQTRMIELCRPRAFMPIHGTRAHLERHAALASSLGVTQTLIVENGEVARLTREGLARDGAVVAGKVATNAGLVLDDETLRERRQLGRGGIVFVVVEVAAEAARVTLRGIPHGAEVIEAARVIAVREMRQGASRSLRLAERVRRAVRRELERILGQRPVVEVTVIEAEP
ncbi:MAG: ribonuclease J [Polyangiaceae bacterium]